MSSPFIPDNAVGRPAWELATNPASTFTPLSSTGQEQITGGYGLGTYGGGGYGTGDGVTIAYNQTTMTQWTEFTLR